MVSQVAKPPPPLFPTSQEWLSLTQIRAFSAGIVTSLPACPPRLQTQARQEGQRETCRKHVEKHAFFHRTHLVKVRTNVLPSQTATQPSTTTAWAMAQPVSTYLGCRLLRFCDQLGGKID